MLKHEEDARKVFTKAYRFKPVNRLGRTIGWSFFVPRDKMTENSNNGYSWVDLEGNVPSDIYGTERQAANFLRSYQKMKQQIPTNTLGRRA